MKNCEETHIIAIITCLRSFSTFRMFATDCAQNMSASQELSLYWFHKQQKRKKERVLMCRNEDCVVRSMAKRCCETHRFPKSPWKRVDGWNTTIQRKYHSSQGLSKNQDKTSIKELSLIVLSEAKDYDNELSREDEE